MSRRGDDDERYAGSEDLLDSLYDASLRDLEERQALERAGRVAANIEIDLEQGGPLGLYIKSRRQEASEALRVLAEVDPRDAVSVAMAQSVVREYLRAVNWVAAKIEESEAADEIIKRDYGNDDEQQ